MTLSANSFLQHPSVALIGHVGSLWNIFFFSVMTYVQYCPWTHPGPDCEVFESSTCALMEGWLPVCVSVLILISCWSLGSCLTSCLAAEGLSEDVLWVPSAATWSCSCFRSRLSSYKIKALVGFLQCRHRKLEAQKAVSASYSPHNRNKRLNCGYFILNRLHVVLVLLQIYSDVRHHVVKDDPFLSGVQFVVHLSVFVDPCQFLWSSQSRMFVKIQSFWMVLVLRLALDQFRVSVRDVLCQSRMWWGEVEAVMLQQTGRGQGRTGNRVEAVRLQRHLQVQTRTSKLEVGGNWSAWFLSDSQLSSEFVGLWYFLWSRISPHSFNQKLFPSKLTCHLLHYGKPSQRCTMHGL